MTAVLDARPTTDNLTLHHCAVADLHKHVGAESVDWIFTDPPYPREFMPCFGELSDFAAHALKPGGGLMVMTGQLWLPEILNLLVSNQQMQYHWTLSFLMLGRASMVRARSAFQTWKPLVWISKGKPSFQTWIHDNIKCPTSKITQQHHHWGQSMGGMVKWLDKFVKPGDLICDPFLGGGTTAVAALDLECRFVGADIDEDCLRITRERLTERLF